jgi:hypothetical protein
MLLQNLGYIGLAQSRFYAECENLHSNPTQHLMNPNRFMATF